MGIFVGIVAGILTVFVVPLVLTKTTERGRFDWIHPYLRETWTGIVALYLLLLAWMEKDYLVTERSHFNSVWSYVVVALVFALIGISVWTITGLSLPKPSKPEAKTESTTELIAEPSIQVVRFEIPDLVPQKQLIAKMRVKNTVNRAIQVKASYQFFLATNLKPDQNLEEVAQRLWSETFVPNMQFGNVTTLPAIDGLFADIATIGPLSNETLAALKAKTAAIFFMGVISEAGHSDVKYCLFMCDDPHDMVACATPEIEREDDNTPDHALARVKERSGLVPEFNQIQLGQGTKETEDGHKADGAAVLATVTVHNYGEPTAVGNYQLFASPQMAESKGESRVQSRHRS